ncbi:DUF4347 domain-containing protein, partial [Microcoleus sp. BROC3]|uniref:DUF4347 domain-containing protein n=1 Tax=Microcoleus sp. BROC3 TaxID=3055323 RepID=UPI002FCF4898
MKTINKINLSSIKNIWNLTGSTSDRSTAIAIIDPTIPECDRLLQGITPGIQTYTLETQIDAVAQITKILAKHTNIQTLHIISHGSSGTLYLDTTELNSSNIKNYKQQLQQWRRAFTPNANIILYGCNVAAGETGSQFLTHLHQLTGANIAANPHPTGNSTLGGTWDIPQLIPPSPQAPKLALTEATLKTYSGVLGLATQVTFATGDLPVSVSIGDFNGDGLPDLAVANFDSNNVSILLNTTPTNATTPTFATQVTFATGSAPISVSIGDINGDGRPDLAVANIFSNNASILLNTTATGATTPTFATQVTFATGTSPYSVSIGDINGDGRPDLAVTNRDDDTVSILLNTTPTNATTPTFATQVTFATGNSPRSVSIGDINGDGRPDLAVANRFSNTASILLNKTPNVTSVTATTADGSYGVGATIAITVTFDAAVTVTGTPQLQLETGTTDRFATYISGSGGTILTFNYVVQAGDTTPDLEYLATTNTLTLNGGTIQDNLATNADLTLPALATANSLGGSKAIVIDTQAPTIASVTSTTTDGSYNTTGNINVTVNFSEAVTLAGGNMSVALDTGGTVTIAPFTGTSAVGTYTPAAGQNSTDLNSTGLTLAVGATLRDAAGNNATLTIPAGQSLADSKAIIVDTVVPTVALTSASPTTTNAPFLVTATFSESVTGFIASDVNLTNSTISNFTGSGTTYNFT